MTIRQLTVPHHGRVMDADFYRPEASLFPAVVVCHGYGGDKRGMAWVGRALAEAGIGALCVSLCGGGRGDASGFPSTSMTLYTERDDALAALDLARTLPGVDPARVYLFGESQGGLASVLAAEQARNLAGLILLFPALCIPDDWNRRLPADADIPETLDFWNLTLGSGFFRALRTMDVPKAIAAYRGPVLLLHGDEDPIVPIEYSRRAAEDYADAALVEFPGEKHGFTPPACARVIELTTAMVLNGARPSR